MLDFEPTGAGDSTGTPASRTDSPTATRTLAATTPAPRRRRTASRPAGAPPEGAETETAGGDAPAKKATARKRTAKKATAASAAPEAAAPESAAEAPAKKTTARKRSAKKATAEAAAPEAATPESAAEAPAKKTTARKRTSKKATAAQAGGEGAASTGSSADDGAPPVPAVLFQPPPAAPAPRRSRKTAAVAPQDETTGDENAVGTAESGSSDEGAEDSEGGPRRRRRRGGRGRRGRGGEGSESGEGSEDSESSGEGRADADEESDDSEGDEGSTSRRRRRRRSKSGNGAEPTSDDPPNTVVRVREPRAKSEPRGRSEQTSIKGSVRIEAKKQRRREGREAGRRRPPVLTESEFLARRESVERVMVVRQVEDRTQIAVLEDGVLVEHHVSRESNGSMIGNVYLGRVQNVLPSMEAAFVDIGRGRNAVLYAGEVNWDAAGLDGQPKRIEFALKSGDAVLVQVTKDPIGTKGSRLTSQVSLPGRYLVYVPDGAMTGISRKLPDTERSRLKSILKRIVPEHAGVIVRTAAEGASEEELARDVERLASQWEEVQKKAKTAAPPTLLYGEPDMTVRVIRDIFNEDFKRVVVSGSQAWDVIDEYVTSVAPDLHDRIEKWTGSKDVWSEFRIDEQLMKALDRKVWLPSGGSLVIDRTEAMTVVDVNTGKFTGQGGNLEDTVTTNNIEAAEEIVRQLRLRDIGGIIVVDFIDMVLESNRDLVLRRLLECLGRDRTKHQVAEVTSLGLVQMTRKRVGQGLLEVFSTPCEHCRGRGLTVSMEPTDDKPHRHDTPPPVKHKDASKEVAKVASASRRGKAAKAASESDAVAEPVAAAESAAPPAATEAPVAEKAASEQAAPESVAPRARRRRVATKPAGDPSIPVADVV